MLFDFDGTLADTFETGAALINEFASRFGYKTIDFAKKRNLSARELVRLSGVKWWQIPRLVKFFKGSRLETPTIFIRAEVCLK